MNKKQNQLERIESYVNNLVESEFSEGQLSMVLTEVDADITGSGTNSQCENSNPDACSINTKTCTNHKGVCTKSVNEQTCSNLAGGEEINLCLTPTNRFNCEPKYNSLDC